jgi:hypothetical protein
LALRKRPATDRARAHITAPQLTKRINQLGISRLERQGPLSYLVSEAPAPVATRATGYSLDATTASAVLSGTNWANYAVDEFGWVDP